MAEPIVAYGPQYEDEMFKKLAPKVESTVRRLFPHTRGARFGAMQSILAKRLDALRTEIALDAAKKKFEQDERIRREGVSAKQEQDRRNWEQGEAMRKENAAWVKENQDRMYQERADQEFLKRYDDKISREQADRRLLLEAQFPDRIGGKPPVETPNLEIAGTKQPEGTVVAAGNERYVPNETPRIGGREELPPISGSQAVGPSKVSFNVAKDKKDFFTTLHKGTPWEKIVRTTDSTGGGEKYNPGDQKYYWDHVMGQPYSAEDQRRAMFINQDQGGVREWNPNRIATKYRGGDESIADAMTEEFDRDKAFPGLGRVLSNRGEYKPPSGGVDRLQYDTDVYRIGNPGRGGVKHPFSTTTRGDSGGDFDPYTPGRPTDYSARDRFSGRIGRNTIDEFKKPLNTFRDMFKSFSWG